jgi:amino acid transporter
VGVFVAGVFFVGTLFLGGGGIYLGLGILIQGFSVSHISTSTIPAWWLFALIFLVLLLVLNYVGIRLGIGLMLGFAAVSFTAMTILAIAIISQGGQDGNTLQMFKSRDDVDGDPVRRRAPRHPALRRVRGGRLDRRGEP